MKYYELAYHVAIHSRINLSLHVITFQQYIIYCTVKLKIWFQMPIDIVTSNVTIYI